MGLFFSVFKKMAHQMGYSLEKRKSSIYSDIQEEEFWAFYEKCKPFTMTSVERMYALYKSVNYVLDRGVLGDFVECGVWRGGCGLMMAQLLAARGITDRKIYLFDTFEGMTPPTAEDVNLRGESAATLMSHDVEKSSNGVWCIADLDDVQHNLALAGLNPAQIIFVKGKVEETLPEQLPQGPISLLRLDTDWYTSTKHEMDHLYPQLVEEGILIIDDYGHWKGARRAIDEYLAENAISLLLQRIDYTGRLAIKPLKK